MSALSPPPTAEEVADFMERVEDGALMPAEWNHAGHLIAAVAYVVRYPAPEDVARMRATLERLNAHFTTAHGVVPKVGYHETLTRFWLAMVRRVAEAHPTLPLAALTALCLAEYGGRKDLAREYYSEARLFSPEARAGWVEPDLRPLRRAAEIGLES